MFPLSLVLYRSSLIAESLKEGLSTVSTQQYRRENFFNLSGCMGTKRSNYISGMFFSIVVVLAPLFQFQGATYCKSKRIHYIFGMFLSIVALAPPFQFQGAIDCRHTGTRFQLERLHGHQKQSVLMCLVDLSGRTAPKKTWNTYSTRFVYSCMTHLCIPRPVPYIVPPHCHYNPSKPSWLLGGRHSETILVADPRESGYNTQPTSVCPHFPSTNLLREYFPTRFYFIVFATRGAASTAPINVKGEPGTRSCNANGDVADKKTRGDIHLFSPQFER